MALLLALVLQTWSSGGLAFAGSVGDGGAAFDQGHLDDAIAAWSGPAEAGSQPSGVISYDLGVAWYRKGDFPRSIAHFRAAERLRPRDGWVSHNLALARAAITNLPDPVALPVWMSVLTPGELGLLAVMVTAAGSLGMAVRRMRWAATGVWGLGLLSGVLAVNGARDLRLHPVAVVVDDEVALRDAASVEAGERARLVPGTEVRVERTLDAFFLVEDARGRRGWIPHSAVALAWTGVYGRTEEEP